MRPLGLRATWLFLLLLLPVAGACTGDPAPADDAQLAPPVAATTLDGDSVRLADLRGQPVLLNVWATWCAPCRQEIPELQALHERHADQGLRVVGVTVDGRHMGDEVRSFVEDMGMTYDVWWDSEGAVIDRLEAVGVPVTVLVDREGRIAWRHTGVIEPGDPELEAAVREAL